jgi:hypothetical protein
MPVGTRARERQDYYKRLHDAFFGHVGAWTEADYFALPDSPVHTELVDGALLVTPSASVAHQRLVLQLTNLLAASCPDPGWETLPGGNVRLWRDHVRGPDVVVARAGLAGIAAEVSDVLLLAEVTSPGNHREDRVTKHRDYAEAGVPFYLRVDLHLGLDALEAVLFALEGGAYVDAARSVDGMLRSGRPWPFEADLRALARGRRTQ